MKRIFTILILIILCSFTYAQSNQNIEKVLDDRGVIKPNSSGSYNTAGYTMTYGNHHQPVFNKINSPQNTNAYNRRAINEAQNCNKWSVTIFQGCQHFPPFFFDQPTI
jgi:hypothetical protein